MSNLEYCVAVVKFGGGIEKETEVMPKAMMNEWVKRYIKEPYTCEVYTCEPGGKKIKKMALGGDIGKENLQMLLNNNKQIAHHTEELKKAVKGKNVPAWVVAKVNRAASDLSDATHYLDGQSENYAKGGAVVGAKFKHDGKDFEIKKVQEGSIYTTNGKIYSLKALESFGVTFNKERAKSNNPRGIRGKKREEMEYQLEDLKNDLRYAKQDLRDIKRGMEEEAGEKGDNWTDADANRYGEQMNFIEKQIESLEKQIAEKEEKLSYAKGGGVGNEKIKSIIQGRTGVVWNREFSGYDDLSTKQFQERWKRAEQIAIKELKREGKLPKTFADGGGVEGGLSDKINHLYEKSGFINSDFNWKLKLLEMLQDQSIEAYNIYQKLSKQQKEDVLQEQFEVDNDMGSDGDGDIKTTKQNINILLKDAKKGKKYAKGGGVDGVTKLIPIYTKRDKKGYRYYVDSKDSNKLYAEKNGTLYKVNEDLNPSISVVRAFEKQDEKFSGILPEEHFKGLEPLHYEKMSINKIAKSFNIEDKMAKGGGVGEILSDIDDRKYSTITKEWGDIHIIPTSDSFWDEIKILLDKSNIKYTAERYDVGTEYFKIKDKSKYANGGGVGVTQSKDGNYYIYPDNAKKTTMGVQLKNGGELAKYDDLSELKPMVINDSEPKKSNKKPQGVIDEIDITIVRKGVELKTKQVTSSRDVFAIFKELWSTERLSVNEDLNVLFLNQNNRVVSYYQHSKGGINQTTVDIEMVCALAIKCLAKGVIVAHNHPSENLRPSEADINFTRKLKTALALFSVNLLDSLIITQNSYFSFADDGLMKKGGTLKIAEKKYLQDKVKKVISEFNLGKLKTSAGKKVTDVKQALAIGYSEAKAGWKHRKQKRK